MFPKTSPPGSLLPLPDVLDRRGALPLWEAGTLIRSLLCGCMARHTPPPSSPGELLVGPGGQFSCTAGPLCFSSGIYSPPEERLQAVRNTDPRQQESAMVYRLCALFYHLSAGRPLDVSPAGSLRGRRACLRELVHAAGLGPEAASCLLRLLDRGLRLEPARRFPSLAEFLEALDETAAQANRHTANRLSVLGIAGFYSGRRLPLCFPAVLGRQPEACGILFPAATPGVSRIHCRLELCWGSVTVTDLASTYGTFLGEVRLEPHIPVRWESDVRLCLGSARQSFILLQEPLSSPGPSPD